METTNDPDDRVKNGLGASAPQPRAVMDVARPAPNATRATRPMPAATTVRSMPKTQPAEVTLHKAPPQDEDDGQDANLGSEEVSAPQQQPIAPRHHPGAHKPIGAIILIIMGMIILSGLAILVYLNS